MKTAEKKPLPVAMDWSGLAREMADAARENTSKSAQMATAGQSSPKLVGEARRAEQKARVQGWLALGRIGVAMAEEGVSWAAKKGLRAAQKTTRLSAFARLADRLDAKSDTLLDRIGALLEAFSRANGDKMALQGRDRVSQEAYDLAWRGNVHEAADLFLRHPFDPRVEAAGSSLPGSNHPYGRTGFASALLKGREEGQKTAHWEARHEAVIEEAIQVATALEEAIAMRLAIAASKAPLQSSASAASDPAGDLSADAPGASIGSTATKLPGRARRL